MPNALDNLIVAVMVIACVVVLFVVTVALYAIMALSVVVFNEMVKSWTGQRDTCHIPVSQLKRLFIVLSRYISPLVFTEDQIIELQK